jgi:hypothetical protein
VGISGVQLQTSYSNRYLQFHKDYGVYHSSEKARGGVQWRVVISELLTLFRSIL